jgi:hypothetical protein
MHHAERFIDSLHARGMNRGLTLNGVVSHLRLLLPQAKNDTAGLHKPDRPDQR